MAWVGCVAKQQSNQAAKSISEVRPSGLTAGVRLSSLTIVKKFPQNSPNAVVIQHAPAAPARHGMIPQGGIANDKARSTSGASHAHSKALRASNDLASAQSSPQMKCPPRRAWQSIPNSTPPAPRRPTPSTTPPKRLATNPSPRTLNPAHHLHPDAKRFGVRVRSTALPPGPQHTLSFPSNLTTS